MSVTKISPSIFEEMILVVASGKGVVGTRGWAAIHLPGISLISSSAISLLYPLPRTASNTTCIRMGHVQFLLTHKSPGSNG